MPSSKIPAAPTCLERSVEEGHFLWVLSFGPAKESTSPGRAKELDFDLPVNGAHTWPYRAFVLTGVRLFASGDLLSLLVHCAEGANGEAGPKGEHRRCE
jgi:hypothetical protein